MTTWWVLEGSDAQASCILRFSTYLFLNPPSPPRAFSPQVPKTEPSQFSGSSLSCLHFLLQPQDGLSSNPCPFRTIPLLCLQLKLYNPVLCAAPMGISKLIFEISGKMLSLSSLALAIESRGFWVWKLETWKKQIIVWLCLLKSRSIHPSPKTMCTSALVCGEPRWHVWLGMRNRNN